MGMTRIQKSVLHEVTVPMQPAGKEPMDWASDR